MKAKLYLETTIASYLTSRPTRDLVVAAHQRITQEWWDTRRGEFDLFVSQLVLEEAGRGDAEVAASRLRLLKTFPILSMKPEALDLARSLTRAGPIPQAAAADALHIAVSTVHGMDFLLTWNCAHLANARIRLKVEAVCRAAGYDPPVICTPEELMGE